MAIGGRADADFHQHPPRESQFPMGREHQKMAMPFHKRGTGPPILLHAESTGLPMLWMGGSPMEPVCTNGLWEHIQVTLPAVWYLPGLSIHVQPRGLQEEKDTNICIGGWRCPGNCFRGSPWLCRVSRLFLQGIMCCPVSGTAQTSLALKTSVLLLLIQSSQCPDSLSGSLGESQALLLLSKVEGNILYLSLSFLTIPPSRQ